MQKQLPKRERGIKRKECIEPQVYTLRRYLDIFHIGESCAACFHEQVWLKHGHKCKHPFITSRGLISILKILLNIWVLASLSVTFCGWSLQQLLGLGPRFLVYVIECVNAWLNISGVCSKWHSLTLK